MSVPLIDIYEDSPPVILRPYQERMVSAWEAFLDRGGRRGLIVAATGTGKTTVFASIIRNMAQDPAFAALVLAHRHELLEQACDRIRLMNRGLSCAIDSGRSEAPRGTSVVVASVQAVGMATSKRLDWLGPNLVICDESHHAAAVTYQNCFRRFGCYDDDGGTALLGVTATPHRLDNKALFDTMGSKRAIFEDIIFSYDIVAAIKDGFLVDLRGYRAAAELNLDHVKKTAGDYNQAQLEKVVNTHPVNELAFKSWDEVASNRRTIVFCAGVDHAKDVAALFADKGVTAEAVWGDMHQQEREQVIRRFRSGKTQVLCNRDIATEGFDVPEAACILLLRPTQSWSLFTQMVGRGLRVLPGVIDGIGEPSSRRHAIGGSSKPDCIIIDIVDNTGLHSVSERPDDGTVPSLQALVGLPSALDLEGRTLAEAVEEFEELPDMVKAAAFRRPTSFSGLSAKLTQVEMLSEVEMPQEAIGAGANLYWIKTGEGRYVIDCGRGADETMSRTAALEVDIIGNWTLTLKSQTRNEVYAMPSTMEEAFISAEATIRKYFFGVTQIAGRNAAWRKGAPTDKQVQLLVRLGVDRVLVHEMIRDGTMDKGKASSMITLLQTNGGSNA